MASNSHRRTPKSARHRAVGDNRPPPGSSKLAGVRGLFVVATPIGNLGDMSERARTILAAVDVIACEDTRVSGVLLTHFAIATPTIVYHDHNAERVRPALLGRLESGEAVALISDAGTPLISDPGFKLVAACIERNIPVTPAPGPSAVMTALMVAGLPTDRFMFAGFLPSKVSARAKDLAALANIPATLVFFESPGRAAETLSAMAAAFGNRPAALCRELTKLYEETRRGNLTELADGAERDPPRGEVVIVVAGASEVAPADDAAVDRMLHQALKTKSVRDAAQDVAEVSGRPRREVYRRALMLAGQSDIEPQ